jgi:hypothetical protein
MEGESQFVIKAFLMFLSGTLYTRKLQCVVCHSVPLEAGPALCQHDMTSGSPDFCASLLLKFSNLQLLEAIDECSEGLVLQVLF